MSGLRLIKGKYGSICDRKNSRHSSSWRDDSPDGDGEYIEMERTNLYETVPREMGPLRALVLH